MPTATAPLRSPAADSLPKLSSVIETAQSALADYAERPGDPKVWQALLSARRSAAKAIAGLPPAQKSGQDFAAALELLREFSTSGAADCGAAGEDLALVQSYARHGWPGLLAAMLLVPAWQWPESPRLDDVPTWLWPVFAAYIFYAPNGFCVPGHADAYAAHYLRRLTELARLAERNRGSAAVRAVLTLYCGCGSCVPLYLSADSLRRHLELRGRILALASGLGRQEEPVMLPRSGRRLRLGFVSRDFGAQTETYTTLPCFENLDPDRFEAVLFALHEGDNVLETYARNHSAEFHVLPSELDAQVRILRDAALDVVIFGANVTALCNEVARLALYRVAPLQIANSSSCTTTGLPEIDLYVSGALTESPEASAHFTERLALLPGPAHAFDYEADRQEPTTNWTRAALGLSDDSIVFVSAANYQKITPEVQEAWASLLAAVPGSRLLLHSFNSVGESSYPIKRFCAGFDGVLAAHGVADDRLLISTMHFPSRTDVCGLLGVGDIYLDTYPFAGGNSLVDPLEAGIPVVVWEGSTFRSRMGGGLLRSLGLEELIVHDAAAYHELAVRLAKDRDWRGSLQRRIQDKMNCMPLFLDTLAASDSFGALVEKAYDELFQCGREAFRSESTPLVAEPVADPMAAIGSAAFLFSSGWFSEAADEARRILAAHPAHPAARQLLAAALLREERGDRALTYLLAAVRHAGNSAALWHDLAVALHHNGRTPESLQALQTCLRLDASRDDSRQMLQEWEAEAGDAETAAEAVKSTQSLAPGDLRLGALVETTAVACEAYTG